MIFSYVTLATALILSVSAIYYSVTGLAAIFAGAALTTLIMGTILESSKLVTVVWLHRYWHQATWWLKTYLVIAVIVLMFITSMGIFGGLSNAHVQQTAQGDSATAQLERINSEIARQEAVVSRAEDKIESAQSEGVGGDSIIQSQIDREQERIDRAYERVEPAIQEQRDIIDRQEGRILDDIEEIDTELDSLDAAVSNGEIATAQSIIGVQSDGIMGPNTREAIENYRDRKSDDKDALEERLDEVDNDSRVIEAREEIDRLRKRVESQVEDSQNLITRLRSQLGTNTGEDIDAVIDEQTARIESASGKIDNLTEEKFEIEAKTRQLEAEVGPIKYIAEFVYGEEADQNLLEKAVQWVIVIIIFVFDPLAVLLLIASQYTFRWNGQDLFDHVTPPPPTSPPTNKNNGGSTENTNSNNTNNAQPVTESNEKYSNIDETFGNSDFEWTQKVDTPHYNYTLDYETAYNDVYNDDRLATNYDLEAPVSSETENPEHFYTIDETNDLETTDFTENLSEEHPYELTTGYVEYRGKRYTRDVFQRLYPKIQLQSDNDPRETNAGFGTEFPTNPERGDLFLRVDYLPTRLFKWNGQKWIPVDKEQTDQYAYHDAYIDHLIEKISTGEYDPELLTDLERTQLEERLKDR